MVLLVDPDVNSLLDLHYHPHRHAGSGQPGQGGNRNGSSGQDLVVPVPPGTVVQTPDGEVLADLINPGSPTSWPPEVTAGSATPPSPPVGARPPVSPCEAGQASRWMRFLS